MEPRNRLIGIEVQPGQFVVIRLHDEGESETELAVSTYRQQTRFRLPVQGRWWVMGGHRFDEHHYEPQQDLQLPLRAQPR